MHDTANLAPDANEFGALVGAHCLTVLPRTPDAIIDAVVAGWPCHLGKPSGEQTVDQRSDEEDLAWFCHVRSEDIPVQARGALFVDHLPTMIGITRRLACEGCSHCRTA
jgi:hypothetical protein